jgi:hypothetical protein
MVWLAMLLLVCGIGGCNVLIGSNNTVTEKGVEADTKIIKKEKAEP